MKLTKMLSKKDAPNPIQKERKMGDNDFIVSKTDKRGIITYCNRIFMDMAGYTREELIGANHNLIRHPDMPAVAFKYAWDTIKAKKEFFGFVKNLSKDGGYYWVFAYITADVNENGEITGYTSFRRKPPQSAIDTIVPIYETLLKVEKEDGIQKSFETLLSVLDDNKISYDEFVLNLQREVKENDK